MATRSTDDYKPRKFNSPVYAVHALYKLYCFEFILYRGRAIVALPEGFKAECKNGKWTRIFPNGLTAIEAIDFEMDYYSKDKNLSKEGICRPPKSAREFSPAT